MNLSRYETVRWYLFDSHGDTTLGELRTLLREVADWPDEAMVECDKITIRRPRPVLTQSDA